MKRLVNYMIKHQLNFTMTKNDDGDDYHLEFIYRNEYYEVRTDKEAHDLLKYLKQEYDLRPVWLARRRVMKELRQLNKELKRLNKLKEEK